MRMVAKFMELHGWYSIVAIMINRFTEVYVAPQIWMHPDDWESLRDASGPPRAVAEREYRKWVAEAQRQNPSFVPVGLPTFSDGDEVGQIHGCVVRIDSSLPRFKAKIRNTAPPVPGRLQILAVVVDDAHFGNWLKKMEHFVPEFEVPIGPFAPAVEPAGGWGRPLFLPR